jgi:hypothetical protein
MSTLFVVMTRMNDINASDAAIDSQVFGPFASIAHAKKWARADRKKHYPDTDAIEVHWEEEFEVGFGEFVWHVKPLEAIA